MTIKPRVDFPTVLSGGDRLLRHLFSVATRVVI